MKHLFGFIALLLGLLGLLASLAALGGAWVVRGDAIEGGTEALEHAGTTLQTAETKLGNTLQVVTWAKNAVDPAAKQLDKLAAQAGSPNPAEQKELAAKVDDLSARLKQLESLVDLAESMLSVMNKTSKSARKIPLLSLALPKETPSPEKLEGAAEALKLLSDILKPLREALDDIRANKKVRAELLQEVAGKAGEVERKLATVETQVNQLKQRVAKIREEAKEVRDELPGWVTAGTIALSVVLAWIALGQLALLAWGLRKMRGAAA
jgi:chromosome segregation ATPase